jgi:hypothetical protein
MVGNSNSGSISGLQRSQQNHLRMQSHQKQRTMPHALAKKLSKKHIQKEISCTQRTSDSPAASSRIASERRTKRRSSDRKRPRKGRRPCVLPDQCGRHRKDDLKHKHGNTCKRAKLGSDRGCDNRRTDQLCDGCIDLAQWCIRGQK